MKNRFILLLLAVLFSGCASSLVPHSEPVSYTPAPPRHAAVWKEMRNQLPDREAAGSWFSPLDTGQEALVARIALIDSAVDSLDMQYFLWLEDKVGSLLFERLLAAAQRGVRIRLLMDDSFLAGEDSVMLTLMSHPHIDVRIFNPFSVRSESMVGRYLDNLHDLSRTNHRMHNKLMVADDTVAILGGRNIADEYFGFGESFNFRDFDLLMTGTVVQELSDSFDLFWNSGWAFPVPEVERRQIRTADLEELRRELRRKASPLDGWIEENRASRESWEGYWREQAGAMLHGHAELLLDLPDFDREMPVQLTERLLELFGDAQGDLYAVSAYLIMTENLLRISRELVERGVRVRYLTNSLASTNHVPAHSAYRRHRKALLESGSQLNVLRPDARMRSLHEIPGFSAKRFGLHGKVAMLDDDKVFVGTLNLDPRSMFLNTEIGLLVHSSELNALVRKAFLPDLEPENSWRLKLSETGQIEWHSHDGVLTSQPAAGPGQRLLDFFVGLFPVEAQL